MFEGRRLHISFALRDVRALPRDVIGCKDALDAMLITQLVGLHDAVVNCLARAAHEGLPLEVKSEQMRIAGKLSNAFAGLLDRHRGKSGEQRVRVEHVHINAGAQAVIAAPSSTGGIPGQEKNWKIQAGARREPAARAARRGCGRTAGGRGAECTRKVNGRAERE
jgi:hypothetical protein